MILHLWLARAADKGTTGAVESPLHTRGYLSPCLLCQHLDPDNLCL